jgi:hypothetical protein
MTGREGPSAEILLERLAVREASIAARGPHISYPVAKLGSHSGPDVASACALTSLP